LTFETASKKVKLPLPMPVLSGVEGRGLSLPAGQAGGCYAPCHSPND